MKKTAVLLALWILCILGIRFGFNESVWQALRNHGLGDHALGVLFVWIPIFILAFEWIAAVGIPILLSISLYKKSNPRG
jgi:hypothetical protein